MADRVKYLILGVLFLVVAGVIAYDKWNAVPEQHAIADNASGSDKDFVLVVGPEKKQETPAARPANVPGPLVIPPQPPPPVQRKPAPKPPSPGPKPAPQPVAPARTHVVRSGESLEAIALHYYGTRKGIAWIAKANHLPDANRIDIKQRLLIPARKELRTGVGGGKNRTPVAKRARTKPRTIPGRYLVKSGDGDLYAICRRFYGSKGLAARVARIMRKNSLWSARVKPGTTLVLLPK